MVLGRPESPLLSPAFAPGQMEHSTWRDEDSRRGERVGGVRVPSPTPRERDPLELAGSPCPHWHIAAASRLRSRRRTR